MKGFDLSLKQARRIALTAQGFAESRRHAAPGKRHFGKVAERLGVIQIDSVNVLTRTHYLPAFSRLGDYPQGVLEAEAWGKKRTLFEYWGHEASLLPLTLDGQRPGIRLDPPRLGQHNDALLQELGYSPEEARALSVPLSQGGSP